MDSKLMFDNDKNVNRVCIGVVLVFILMGIIIIQLSIGNYKSNLDKQSKFLELEKKRISQSFTYVDLAKDGIRVIAVPAPIIILFYDSSTFPGELISSINNLERLDLHKQQKGESSFENQAGGVLDFSWFILTMGAIFPMVLGWILFKNPEQIKFRTNFISFKSIWGKIVFGNISWIIVSLILIMIVTGLQILVNGLWSSDLFLKLFLYILVSVICIVPLFLISAIFGTIRIKALGFLLTALFWFVLLFLWPKVQNSILYKNSQVEITSVYELETKKMDVVVNFEKKSREILAKCKTEQERKQVSVELMEHFWNNEYKQIEALESEMISKTEKIAKKYNGWSIINFSTFYRSVCNELSSRGYNSFLSFYRDMQKKQRRFLRFYIDKRFHENSTKVEPFLEDDEYIYKLKSSLPEYFFEGIIVCLFINVILLFISYRSFKRYLFPAAKKDAFSELNINLEKGKHYKFEYIREDFPQWLYNIFMGNARKFSGKISIDGENIASGEKKNFVYLPSPDIIDGNLRVKEILDQIYGVKNSSLRENITEAFDKTILEKRFGELGDIEQVELLTKLARLRKPDIYILNNFINLPKAEDEVFVRIFNEMRSVGANCIILELTTPQYQSHLLFDCLSEFKLKGATYYELKITA